VEVREKQIKKIKMTCGPNNQWEQRIIPTGIVLFPVRQTGPRFRLTGIEKHRVLISGIKS
jgi:hypothetical protein